jgi:voltage-gated potassium channel
VVDTDRVSDPPSSAALERIHRLERQERRRIERQQELAQRRQDKLAGAPGVVGDRGDAIHRFEHSVRVPFAAIGVAWAVIGIVILTTDNKGLAPEALVTTLFVLWLGVVLESVVRYVLAPNRRQYFAARRVEPVMVVFPLFQVWRLVGVERVNVMWSEAAERGLAILRHRSLFRVLLAAAGLLFLGAWLVLLFDSHANGSNIHSYPDALWWAVVTVTTVGYGDRFPVSAGGRAVAVILMMVGIGLIGTLTATVASFFMQEHTDANKEQLQAAHADLGARLGDMDARLARIEAALGRADPASAPEG